MEQTTTRRIALIGAVALLAAVTANGVRAQAGDTKRDGATSAADVTFASHIASIIHSKCTACHRPGQSAPFPLIDYDDVRRRAKQIASVVRTRYMPPWLPAAGHASYRDDRSLSTEQIALIERWVDAGAPEGDKTKTPQPPEFPPGWQLGTPDLVVRPTDTYMLRAAGDDDFRNLLIPIPIDRPRYVRAVEFRFQTPRAVHHAIAQVDRSGSCRRLAAQEDGPGFGGMTMGQSRPPGGHFLGWTPGRAPHEAAGETMFTLRPGDEFVIQLHLVPIGKAAPLRPMIGFYFSDEPPKSSAYALVMRNDRIDIPAGEKNYVLEDHFVLPEKARAVSVYPHAHFLGKALHAFAELPSGKKEWLVRIDDWDFNWQDAYTFAQPIDLPKGTVIRFHYTFDNSEGNIRNPNSPPIRVVSGNRSVDEMATLTLQLELENRDKRRLVEIASWRREIERAPKNHFAHYNLGNELRDAGKLGEAIQAFRASVKLQPTFKSALNNLGTALKDAGKYPEAADVLKKALAVERDADSLNNLGNVERAMGRADRALALFDEAVRLAPKDPIIHNNRGNALLSLGRLDDARKAMLRSVSLDPQNAISRANLGMLLGQIGRYDDAIRHLAKALALRPGLPPAHAKIAILLAAHPDPARRRPKEALRHAVAAVRASQHPDAFEALAIVHAAAGRFEEAAKVQSVAIQRTPPAQRQPRLARLRDFRAKRPFVLPKH